MTRPNYEVRLRLAPSEDIWASSRGVECKGHICPSIEDNLFMPLSPPARAEFAAADGDELGMGGQTPKLSSLRSSSALAANIFDPWRGHDLAPLNGILHMPLAPIELHFEQRMRHGVPGQERLPNIDVVFFSAKGPPVGLECKFCEPYDPGDPYPCLSNKYDGRWAAAGLTRCQELASSIGRSLSFKRLNARQLLKHILGMAYVFGVVEGISLRYLWHDAGCDDAKEHGDELSAFTERVVGEIDFISLTTKELIGKLQQVPEPSSGYHDYLASRYLAA